MHYDWLEAGEHTQRTVAQLSQQLRRFLDDQAWLENRRIMDILHGIEGKALGVRESAPSGEFVSIASIGASLELPMERPLHTPALKPRIADRVLESGDVEVDAAALYSQVVVDKVVLARHIRHALQGGVQVTLRELCERRPLEHGLAELVAYLELADDRFESTIDEAAQDIIVWRGKDSAGLMQTKQACLPRVIYVR